MMKRHRSIAGIVAMSILAIAVAASATTQVKTLGRLKIAPDAGVMAICNDPVVQNVLNEDLRQRPRSGTPVVVTVTVNARELAPGVSMQDLSPGDPSVSDMLQAMGAEPPLLGDTGNKPLEDPYSIAARKQALNPSDPMTQGFRNYMARRSDMANPASPYDNIPPGEIYPTAIVARATASDSSIEFKVVALVDAGDDVKLAKKRVAEEIAAAILH
jgi:hypothetical protein